nr:hypothetical protein [uncultured Anaerocolumna sp.]
MKDKILNLLNYCLQAQEKGHRIMLEFDICSIRLYHFSPRTSDYKAEILKHLTVYYGVSDSVEQLNEMESYLRELV